MCLINAQHLMASLCCRVQDLKPKSMPVLVIMPDNNLSYGLRCDSAAPEPPAQPKPSPESDERGDVTLLSGGHPSVVQPASHVVPATMPRHGELLPSAAAGHDDAAWQHGFACGTAAAAAAFSMQTLQQAPEPGSADDHGAANPAEGGDVETGHPTMVRRPHMCLYM